jgi:hypothetical protein
VSRLVRVRVSVRVRVEVSNESKGAEGNTAAGMIAIY